MRDAKCLERPVVEVENERVDRFGIGRGQKLSARLDYPGNLADGAVQVGEMVQDVSGDDEVE